MFQTNAGHQETVKSVELSYQTRGRQQSLHITLDSVEVMVNGKIAKYKTTKSQWQKIVKTVQKVKLSGIATLKRPSSKAAYDGALIAQLKITTNLKEYNSVSFDHDLPPAKLVETIDAMKATLKNGDF